jgi:acyl-CoA reductase-like NAD-dependent aldehyde dehydrogenase
VTAVIFSGTRYAHLVVPALTVGSGTDPRSAVGPLIEGEVRKNIHALVIEAVEQGATVAVGGGPLGGPRYFWSQNPIPAWFFLRRK